MLPMIEKRLFLAVPLTDSARSLLADEQEKLVPVYGSRGRTRVEAMHVTVKFLGLVKDKLISELAAAVQESVHDISPFQLTLDRLVFFGKPDAPRIVAVTLTPVKPIRFLAEEVDRACTGLGFQQEKRPFSPHITIYRPKKRGRIEGGRPISPVQVPVNELVLYQSELRPDGAVYHALESFPLPGRGESKVEAAGIQ